MYIAKIQQTHPIHHSYDMYSTRGEAGLRVALGRACPKRYSKTSHNIIQLLKIHLCLDLSNRFKVLILAYFLKLIIGQVPKRNSILPRVARYSLIISRVTKGVWVQVPIVERTIEKYTKITRNLGQKKSGTFPDFSVIWQP